jgi:hypothetical protein
MRASASLATFIFTGFVTAGAACGGASSLPESSGTGGGSHPGTGGATGTTSSHGSGATGTTSSHSGSGAATTSSSGASTTNSSSGTGTTTSSGGTSSSSSSSSNSSTGFIPDAGPVGAFPFPPVTYQGGPVIVAPKVVTITFPGDSMASQLATFGTSVTSSSYWDTIRAGYCDTGGNCIGDGPAGTQVALTTAPASSYTDSSQGQGGTLQTFLKGLISGGKVPAPDANTIYALYFPASTTITLDGDKSCRAFDGYHNALTMGAQEVYYAIIPECAAPQMTPPITTLQNTTITASHELIETATDPSLSVTTFTLDLQDPATWGWADVASVEVGDLCVDPFGLGQDETTENGFTVQRIWSATQASAGKNPCVPVPAGEVYFNAFTTVSVVTLDVGKSIDIEVDALADGPMGSWTVLPEDWTDPSNPSPNPYLSFSIQGATNTDAGPEIQMKSGDKRVLTVTLLADPINAPFGEADGVIVSANGTAKTATAAHFWPFIVLTPGEAADAGVMMMKRRETHARHVAFSKGRARLFGWGR